MKHIKIKKASEIKVTTKGYKLVKAHNKRMREMKKIEPTKLNLMFNI